MTTKVYSVTMAICLILAYGVANALAHSQHEHKGMQSSPGAASAPYDLQFIDTMSMHHQHAIDMAKMALKKAHHQELRQLASKMIADQQKDNANMRSWRNRWYARRAKAVNMEMPGMSASMHMDMNKLKTATGPAFDLAFIDMMTAHHQSAIEMARDALNKAEHPELKALAQKIIDEQQKESQQMNQWRSAWSSQGAQ